jgi:hypothetical protein
MNYKGQNMKEEKPFALEDKMMTALDSMRFD